MSYPRICRILLAGVSAALLAGAATPAHAQATGRLEVRVADESGKPIPDAIITIEWVGTDYVMKYDAKSDAKGSLIKAGLKPGRWRITGTKGDLTGYFVGSVILGEAAPITLVLKAGKAAATAVAASKLSPEEIAKRNKQQKDLEDTFNAAKAALDAGNTDEAIVKLKSMTDQSPQCAMCFAKLGDVYSTKKDAAGAEASYKKAVDLDPTLGDVYVALASLYAEQKRFEEATAMSAKANSLSAASGGVGNPTALYNQGVILWNQGKGDEAQPLFEKAVAADPTLADPHYMLGMIYVGKDKKADAIKELEAYLKLAPTGENAATAKAILAQIK